MKQEFLDRMKNYLSADDYNKLIECYKENPVRSLRLNNITIEELTSNMNINLEKISYDQDGYYLLDDNKYGNHPYHHAGSIYFQEPSAMAPVNIYDFKGDELVLDLCASPGGKSSQILSRIPNGVLFANEPMKKRALVLFGNLERLGFSNAVVLNNMPNELSNKFEGIFDVVLVDSPCSGEGMMRKDIEARDTWSIDKINECVNRDHDILFNAVKMLKTGGRLIYSTCTFAKEEDEDMVLYIESLGMKRINATDRIKNNMTKGFIDDTYRFYPFTMKGEGQFMAILEKVCESNTYYKERKKDKENDEYKLVYKFLDDVLDIKIKNIIKEGNRFYIPTTNYDFKGLQVLNYGIELGEVVNKRFIPFHHLFKALGNHFKNKLILNPSDERIAHYLKGEEITDNTVNNGYGVILLGNNVLGGFKASNGQLKNHYPKGLRNMNLYEE